VRGVSTGRSNTGTGRSGLRMSPKYWSTQRSSCAGSKLPETIIVAVAGR